MPLSGELRDAVKSGDYMAVKLALNSKEDYNLDQEVGFLFVGVEETQPFILTGPLSNHTEPTYDKLIALSLNVQFVAFLLISLIHLPTGPCKPCGC